MHLLLQRAPIGAHSDMEEDKELREFLCGGIFSDVTGELNDLAQGAPDSNACLSCLEAGRTACIWHEGVGCSPSQLW